jgi:membrane protein implicated in regulation of membrane protease activity
MWRMIVGGSMVLFSTGTAAGVALLIMLLIDREYAQLPWVAIGTLIFAWGTWAMRRDWQRERQAREFRRENARDREPR